MASRLERLAAQKTRTAAKKAAVKQEDARLDAAIRAEARKTRNWRRYAVGALADQAGLLAWSDTDLAGLFAALGRMGECPNPVAVLEALLDDRGATAVCDACGAPVASALRGGSLPRSFKGRNGEFATAVDLGEGEIRAAR